MSFFLKKTKTKYDVYLQIYESYYDPERKGGAHRSYRAIGYVNKLIESGIEDPIAYFQAEVDELNKVHKQSRSESKNRLISDESPEVALGYFPLKNINDALHVKKYIDLMQSVTDFQFNVYDMLSSLIYARVIAPASKSRTYEETLPKLYEDSDYSMAQLYTGLEYMGQEYEKIIEIYNHQVKNKYGLDTKHTYFDCTNFYFEIDKEDDFRRKGPSKENRRDPIVGMGLLLDSHQIPIGMRLYPGNESEKPVIREVIDSLKERNNITGKTIRVADKGLNCAENIVHALKEGDGYIFSKSVKMLPAKEKEWVLLDNEYKDIKDSSGKLLYRIKECVDEFPYTVTHNGKKGTVKLKEKRVVSFNPKLAEKKRYEINKLVEKAKELSAYKAKKSEFGECSKYITIKARKKSGEISDEDVVIAALNTEAIEEDLKLAGYNLIVTSESHLSSQYIYAAYHNLWRIEESFRVMKSQLDARPVYLQKKETITGHFLVCYLTVLLLRLFQFNVLDNKFGSDEIIRFIRGFKVVKGSDRKFINTLRSSSFVSAIKDITNLPINSYFLNQTDIKKVLSHRF